MGKYVDEAGLTRVVSQTKDLVAASQKVATSSTPGIVKPDGDTLSVQSDGTIGLADASVTKAKLASDISIPDIEYSTVDLEAGVSELAAGKLYFVYE